MTYQTKLNQKPKPRLDYPLSHFFGYIQNFVINANKIPDLFFTLEYQFRNFCFISSAYHTKFDKQYNIYVSCDGTLLVESTNYTNSKKRTMCFEKFVQFVKEHEWILEEANRSSSDFEIFFDNPIKTRRLFNIENTEIRREALKRIGIKKIFKELETKILDYNDKGEMLFDVFFIKNEEKHDDDLESNRMMYVQDGTNHNEFYLLQVPKTWFPMQGEPIKNKIEVTKLHTARAWSFRKHPTDFNPVSET